jgi:hypothetical protein
MFHVIRGSNIFFCPIFTVFYIITLLKGISIMNMPETTVCDFLKTEWNTIQEAEVTMCIYVYIHIYLKIKVYCPN